MQKHIAEDYKNAIKEKYETEKYRNNSDFLLNPSRAKLRNLCFELFNCNANSDDLKVFASFFNFEFTPSLSYKMDAETDKFRPIENFFRGKTSPSSIKTLNMAAILVDFQPRPFLKFSKSDYIFKNNECIDEILPQKKPQINQKIKTLDFYL